MSSNELPQRQHDGWWFVSDRVILIDATTGKLVTGAPSPPGETLREMWQPLSASDNDRLEAAYRDSSRCDLPDCVVIHDSTGQRLSRVSLSDMLVTPVYWEGPPRPARRSIWMQMAASEDVRGGWPVPAEWDVVLEKAYQDHREWLASSRVAATSPASLSSSSEGGTTSSVIEKLVGLEDPLTGYVLVLRKGSLDNAKLTKKSRLDSKPGLFNGKDDSIRLIRGYTSYYIAVTSAIKALSAAGKSTDIPPMVLASPFETCSLEKPPAPTNLIFAVHGIGQKLAGRLGANFINDCDALRAQVKTAIAQRAGDIEDLLVLPVNWRSAMHMSIQSYFLQSDTHELSFENLVSMITLPNIPFIRDVASDVGLDILLYMTPAYFHRIIRATLNEIRRIYKIFLTVGGEGAKQTRISLVGHSLGAAIVSDLLSFIVSDTELDDHDAVNRAAEAVISNLGFPVDRFFALGSPLAMFFLLKQLKPLGCVAHIYDISIEGSSEPRGTYPSLPDPQDSRELHPRKMMFACRQIYNIFHPYDPIAYRMEPLIVPPEEMVNFSSPLRLPYYKKGALHLKRQVEGQMQSLQEKALKAKDDFVNALPEWMRPRSTSPAKLITSADGCDNNTVGRRLSRSGAPFLSGFNRHCRIDFSVEESLLENSYLAAIRSHFSYWDDIDIASFIVVECTNLPARPISPR